ncbi:hypothetical protein BUALT_Bualt19G0086600 [Buddleja alternifolia]|uniref:Serine aminopeptidase S33 domain-containing protein n=1 Tax=Buddleja alternifolia TaxID=168488 RepID=A0AAV6WAI0_9LAMI|nr:hypothetical protein BUALT_Bualt19G0086600 [Buddleja alternifolia]
MESLNGMESTAVDSPYAALLTAAMLIPIYHYILVSILIVFLFLYNFLELHFLQDLFTGFRGQSVNLTFNPYSQVYHDVVSKCRILHGRYLSTPWICSPHLQTAFLHYIGNNPVVNYRRQIFITSDGGTLALDWVMNAEVKKPPIQGNDAVKQDDRNPIIIIIPGLTSDSESAVSDGVMREPESGREDSNSVHTYVKHLGFKMAKRGWNVVVSNHRGLGGVSITSDCFYHGGWTEDVRRVIDHIHCQYSEAPLFVVGTSIGANILICDRYMSRRTRQRFYNKALTIGLKDYAKSHEAVLSRILNWEGIKKALTVRDFDDCATRVVGKYETVDTYYRRCSSSNFVGSVTVPLLCISSLDDPVCTSEAIPFDECRLNTNVVLATTKHGGHLPFFEGLTAKSVWWVRAVDEFFCALQSSPLSQRKKEIPVSSSNPHESSIDHAPYIHVSEEGTITAVREEVAEILNMDQNKTKNLICAEERQKDENDLDQTPVTACSPEQNKTENSICAEERQKDENDLDQTPVAACSPEQDISSHIVAPLKKSLNQVSRQNRKSLWLLAYIAMVTTWPVVGSILAVFFRKKFKNLFSRR